MKGLKRDLHDWRSKLDVQVKGYRSELGELKNTLHSEVDQLRTVRAPRPPPPLPPPPPPSPYSRLPRHTTLRECARTWRGP